MKFSKKIYWAAFPLALCATVLADRGSSRLIQQPPFSDTAVPIADTDQSSDKAPLPSLGTTVPMPDPSSDVADTSPLASVSIYVIDAGSGMAAGGVPVEVHSRGPIDVVYSGFTNSSGLFQVPTLDPGLWSATVFYKEFVETRRFAVRAEDHERLSFYIPLWLL